MPTPFEQELLAMVAQHRRETSQEEPSLPEIIPEALLSVSAQSEIRGARALAEMRAQPIQVTISHETMANAERASHQSMGATLEALLLERAIRETGMSVDHNISAADAFPIEYENDDLVGTTVPNERVRFQIGRQAPPAGNFQRQALAYDTTVVAERGANGRFQATPRVQIDEAGSTSDASAYSRTRAVATFKAPVKNSQAQESVVRKSSYERLLGPSILDD